ncbi:type II TA system antitoxin MqsA family protein [Bradyrhizobium elkanii]
MSKQLVEYRPRTRECIFCGASTATENSQRELFNYKNDDGQLIELSVEIPVISCSSCGESYSDDRAEDIRHDAVCRFLGRLTPSSLKAIRESYGYSQAQWSELTGIGIASIKRWESGAMIQGLAFDRYIRMLGDAQGRDLLNSIVNPRKRSTQVFRTAITAHARKDASVFRLRIERAVA